MVVSVEGRRQRWAVVHGFENLSFDGSRNWRSQAAYSSGAWFSRFFTLFGTGELFCALCLCQMQKLKVIQSAFQTKLFGRKEILSDAKSRAKKNQCIKQNIISCSSTFRKSNRTKMLRTIFFSDYLLRGMLADKSTQFRNDVCAQRSKCCSRTSLWQYCQMQNFLWYSEIQGLTILQ